MCRNPDRCRRFPKVGRSTRAKGQASRRLCAYHASRKKGPPEGDQRAQGSPMPRLPPDRPHGAARIDPESIEMGFLRTPKIQLSQQDGLHSLVGREIQPMRCVARFAVAVMPVLAMVLLASCANLDPTVFKAYEEAHLSLAEASVLAFQPFGTASWVDKVTGGEETYFDLDREYANRSWSIGFHPTELRLAPGIYAIHYHGGCYREPEERRTDVLTMQPGHRYVVRGKCDLTGHGPLRMWIEDADSGEVLLGSKEVPVVELPVTSFSPTTPGPR